MKTLNEVKDDISYEAYQIPFAFLEDNQKVTLIDLIAKIYALEECKDLTNRIKSII